jgi:DNA-binding MarR family transcriptional regulator
MQLLRSKRGYTVDFSENAIERLRAMSSNYGSGVLDRMALYSSGESFLLRLLACKDELLPHAEGGVHPSELQKRMGTSSARVAAILRSLEKKGFITREVDHNDRRRVIVSITAEGRVHADAEMDEMEAVIREIFLNLGEDDTNEFIRILDRVFEEFVKPRTTVVADEGVDE